MSAGRILVVEDEDKLRRVIQLHLESAGFEADGAASAEHAMPLVPMADLIITDLRLPGIDGLQFIQQLQASGLQAAIIVITAHGSIEAAVEAMKLGAADFLQKPFSLDHLTAIVQKVMALQSLRTENQRMREELDGATSSTTLLGEVAAMREIFHTVERVAPTRATVLLAGESGVGKDMIARAIHQHSPRKNHAFVKINCTALPENLMESELFGYEKGALLEPHEQARQIRARRSRHGVSRRNRRCSRQHTSQAAANTAGTAIRAAGIERYSQRGR